MPQRRVGDARRLRTWLGTLLLAAGAASAQTPSVVRGAGADPTSPPTIHMVGDSTMADKPLAVPNPERGWGQILPIYFRAGVRVENHALNGRSTKSFVDQGHWQRVVERLHRGDYVIIQFGHNDSKREDPARYADPWGAYQRNLERYVSETRGRGALPILATPIVRRHFDTQGVLLDRHGDYPKVVRQLADRLRVPLLDLQSRSDELVRRLGPERSEVLYLSHVAPGDYAKLPEGLEDNTHLSAIGASRICDLAADEIRRALPELARWLRD